MNRVEYISGSNWAGNLKSAERVVQGTFEFSILITPDFTTRGPIIN